MPSRAPAPDRPRLPLRPGEGGKGRITEIEGLAALSLDALSSVAYGPEAIVVVLAAAGVGAISLTLPIALAIAALLAVLVVSYRQVIAVHPDGGGAYAVASSDLGRPVALLAAASLIVDYILTVAVSLAAGAASVASAFPVLRGHLVALSLVGLVLLAVVNMFGIADSARALLLPTGIFLGTMFALIAAGLLRAHPAAVVGTAEAAHASEAVGVLLVLKAFAAGCAAVTGVEAIANAVPTFKDPAIRRAQRTELTLGVLLALLLVGLAVLIRIEHIAPRGGVTVLAQLAAGSFGTGWAYYVTNLAVTLALCLAANTSFGGLPVLMSLLARDNRLPHLFGLRTERPVYRFGVLALAILGAVLLLAVRADIQHLIPLYAIGVFIGFTISQVGLVRHWRSHRPPGWRRRALLNGVGSVLTLTAALVFLFTKFLEGAWIVVLLIPTLMLLFSKVENYYTGVAAELSLRGLPGRPRPAAGRRSPVATGTARGPLVLVPTATVSRLTEYALDTALAMAPAGDVVCLAAVTDPDDIARLRRRWAEWNPGVTLTVLPDEHRTLSGPVVRYVQRSCAEGRLVVVLIVEVQPRHRRQEILHNHRGMLLTTALRSHTDAVVATLTYRLRS